jgi:hypothetical protein
MVMFPKLFVTATSFKGELGRCPLPISYDMGADLDSAVLWRSTQGDRHSLEALTRCHLESGPNMLMRVQSGMKPGHGLEMAKIPVITCP